MANSNLCLKTSDSAGLLRRQARIGECSIPVRSLLENAVSNPSPNSENRFSRELIYKRFVTPPGPDESLVSRRFESVGSPPAGSTHFRVCSQRCEIGVREIRGRESGPEGRPVGRFSP